MRKKLMPRTIRIEEGGKERSARARILPGLGANLVSLEVSGTEYIYWNERAYVSENVFSGAFNMFPTPCRLTGCAYDFEGRHIRQKKHGKDVFIHGLVRDEVMVNSSNGNISVSSLEIEPGHPVFEGFPFKCVFTVKHEIETCRPYRSAGHEGSARLTVSFQVKNNDIRNIPFGYGIHPYWRIHGKRGNVLLRIPCEHVMDQEGLIPTGTVFPVKGTELDLRAPKSIEHLELDNTFWRREPGDNAEIIFKALNRRVLIEASAEFTHMIAYTPAGKEFICVENLTSSPNAPNIAAAGKDDVAHLLVVPPGGHAEGWVRYSIEGLGSCKR